MTNEKNTDLAYKGDWCEQTAEFAEACGNKEIRDRNYRRAIEAYETGGWITQALNVARKIKDQEKISELERNLRNAVI